jgi:hypothetical protein
MNLASWTAILALSLILLNQVDFSSAECCGNNGRFGCCGFRKCNFFCCNCDPMYVDGRAYICRDGEQCNFDTSILFGFVSIAGIGIGVGKRSTDTDAYDKFVFIDTDSDGLISIDEMIRWYANKNGEVEKVSEMALQSLFAEFQKMDSNKDKFIEPSEFDSSLDIQK